MNLTHSLQDLIGPSTRQCSPYENEEAAMTRSRAMSNHAGPEIWFRGRA